MDWLKTAIDYGVIGLLIHAVTLLLQQGAH